MTERFIALDAKFRWGLAIEEHRQLNQRCLPHAVFAHHVRVTIQIDDVRTPWQVRVNQYDSR